MFSSCFQRAERAGRVQLSTTPDLRRPRRCWPALVDHGSQHRPPAPRRLGRRRVARHPSFVWRQVQRPHDPPDAALPRQVRQEEGAPGRRGPRARGGDPRAEPLPVRALALLPVRRRDHQEVRGAQRRQGGRLPRGAGHDGRHAHVQAQARREARPRGPRRRPWRGVHLFSSTKLRVFCDRLPPARSAARCRTSCCRSTPRASRASG